MDERCKIICGEYGFPGEGYYPCNRKAKYITPPNPITKKIMYVCGIHKNSIDAMHKKINSNKRCKLIKNIGENNG
jgi:hypothetical protein